MTDAQFLELMDKVDSLWILIFIMGLFLIIGVFLIAGGQR